MFMLFTDSYTSYKHMVICPCRRDGKRSGCHAGRMPESVGKWRMPSEAPEMAFKSIPHVLGMFPHLRTQNRIAPGFAAFTGHDSRARRPARKRPGEARQTIQKWAQAEGLYFARKWPGFYVVRSPTHAKPSKRLKSILDALSGLCSFCLCSFHLKCLISLREARSFESLEAFKPKKSHVFLFCNMLNY